MRVAESECVADAKCVKLSEKKCCDGERDGIVSFPCVRFEFVFDVL